MATERLTGDRRPVVAWIAYDFFNSLLIITGSLYFSKWITLDQGVSQFWYGAVYAFSTLALVLAAPIVGASIDKRGNGRSIFVYTSLLLGTFPVLLTFLGFHTNSVARLVGTLSVFCAISFCYQLSLVPYNWLLPQIRGVSERSLVTRYTGFGEGAGALGSVVGALSGAVLLRFVLGETPNGRLWLQAAMGLLFLFLFILDYYFLSQGLPTVEVDERDADRSFKAVLTEYFRDIRVVLRGHPELWRFLVPFFIYADALLTVQLFLPIYLRERRGLSDLQTAAVFAVALAAAAASSMLFGKRAPKDLRSLILITLVVWLPVFGLLAVLESPLLLWLVYVLAGILFGLLWSASRAYLYTLAPPEVLGRGFGFYSVFDSAASVLGPLLWGAAMFLPFSVRTRYIAAFGAMAALVLLALGLLFLWKPRVLEGAPAAFSAPPEV
jgi:MFS-type transporter involved in bile tolerance (Atg22 family)